MNLRLPEQVLEVRPLIHAITNEVTSEWVARGLLAAGARPVMARDPAEAEAVAAQADALVLNLGTWSPERQRAMLAAARMAADRGVPIVLDPVGAGGIPTRTQAALELLTAVRVTAVRGNSGEIAALAGQSGLVSGVDAKGAGDLAWTAKAARAAARRFGCVVAATGETDLVTDGERTLLVKAGDPMMARITGSGCLVSGLLAAGLASDPESSPLETVAAALLWAGMAGEGAAASSGGAGSFAAAFLDQLGGTSSLPEGRVRPPLAEQLSLYVIVSGQTPLPVLESILDAGVGAIQFREKHLPMGKQVAIAGAMNAICRAAGALFLINDRTDLCAVVGAHGVHLGQEDLPVAEARRLLGPDAIIGATCETEDEARIAEESGADYIGTGPVYATPSKADAGEPYGPAIAGRISAATRLPVVGIGGIGIGGAAPVIATGAVGVAVISSVVGAPDPGLAARTLLAEVLQAKGE